MTRREGNSVVLIRRLRPCRPCRRRRPCRPRRPRRPRRPCRPRLCGHCCLLLFVFVCDGYIFQLQGVTVVAMMAVVNDLVVVVYRVDLFAVLMQSKEGRIPTCGTFGSSVWEVPLACRAIMLAGQNMHAVERPWTQVHTEKTHNRKQMSLSESPSPSLGKHVTRKTIEFDLKMRQCERKRFRMPLEHTIARRRSFHHTTQSKSLHEAGYLPLRHDPGSCEVLELSPVTMYFSIMLPSSYGHY